MDPEEKQLIGSILSDETDMHVVERKENRKRSRLSLNAKEFQPTFLQLSDQISESYGNEIQSFNSTNSQPYINHERQKEKKLSIKIQQFSPKKHSTMQPMNPVEICCLQFNSHPSLEQNNQIKMQLRQDELQFKHCLEQLCGNQNASRNLQKIFDNGTQHQRRLIYEAIEKNLIKTTKDLFGNYLVQKVFLSGERTWKFNLFCQLRGHIVELCKNQYASRVLNRMIEFLKDEDYHLQFEVMEEIKPQIKQLITDNNACFVLLSCFENFDYNLCEFMIKYIESSIYQMSQHTYGCRIIQYMLQKQHSQYLLQTIMDISEQLCICEFGNYIIQFILKSNFKNQKLELIKTIKNNLQVLSYNKYGSNVVEVFLDVIDQEDAKLITNLMLSQQTDDYLFVVFATHPFANYVFKKYLQLEQRIIMPVLQILRNCPQILLRISTSEYGQKIYPLVERSIQFI